MEPKFLVLLRDLEEKQIPNTGIWNLQATSAEVENQLPCCYSQ
jgi:hypothetical protein